MQGAGEDGASEQHPAAGQPSATTLTLGFRSRCLSICLAELAWSRQTLAQDGHWLLNCPDFCAGST